MRTALLVSAAALATATPAQAQDARFDALERRLAEQQQRIEQLEALLARQARPIEQAGGSSESSSRIATPPPAAAPQQLVAAPTAQATGFRIAGLDVGGDMRVRQEWNYGGLHDRSRTAVRARFRGAYAISDKISLGTQIATGDPDDPNSVDVTLGNFVDDFQLALDQAWIRYKSGDLTAYSGKFPQPFQRTDMVWDGDVSPQGIAAAYSRPIGNAKLDARAMWFVIDEAAAARDSDMLGGQLALTAPLASAVKLGLTGSYYHYRLGSVAGADAGDIRGNLFASGRYISDFKLLEGIAVLGWSGPSERWPVTLTADYVRNLGAAVPADTAFNLELAVGRTAKPGDWRVTYNFSEVQVDAVLAAFSQDNIDLSTNYRLHAMDLSFVPAPNLQLDLLWYHYRPLDAAYAGALPPSDWLDRIRLAFMVSF